VPHFAELFRGMQTLGAMEALVMQRLRIVGTRGGRAIDLGCGPGGIATALASKLGMSVLGIDGCAAFVDMAHELAARRRVAGRCEFVVADLAGYVRTRDVDPEYDVAVMLNVWPALRAAKATRGFVREGGVYIIDDAVRTAGASARAWREVPTLAGMTESIEALGDRVAWAGVVGAKLVRENTSRLQRQLRTNAGRLARANPELAETLDAYVRRQREAAGLLRGPIRGAMWVVVRGRAVDKS